MCVQYCVFSRSLCLSIHLCALLSLFCCLCHCYYYAAFFSLLCRFWSGYHHFESIFLFFNHLALQVIFFLLCLEVLFLTALYTRLNSFSFILRVFANTFIQINTHSHRHTDTQLHGVRTVLSDVGAYLSC